MAEDEHREFWLRWCRDFFIIEIGIAGPHVPWLNDLLHAHPEDAAQPEPGWLWRRSDMSPEKTFWQFVRDLDRIPVDRDRAEVRRFYFAHPDGGG